MGATGAGGPELRRLEPAVPAGVVLTEHRFLQVGRRDGDSLKGGKLVQPEVQLQIWLGAAEAQWIRTRLLSS